MGSVSLKYQSLFNQLRKSHRPCILFFLNEYFGFRLATEQVNESVGYGSRAFHAGHPSALKFGTASAGKFFDFWVEFGRLLATGF